MHRPFKILQKQSAAVRANLIFARKRWGKLPHTLAISLAELTDRYGFSLACGDLVRLGPTLYVTHSGLLGLARRHRCVGISVRAITVFCDAASSRWAFEAIVYKSRTCRGFVGYGDADPANTSDLVRGAEMRVAETRAVNRALRKAYGIGICSVEEIGSFSRRQEAEPNHRKRPPANGSGANGQHLLRDRLSQLIRQHQLDPELVKLYAIDYCGVNTLREATREQVEQFIGHVADWAVKDKNALICQLNSYLRRKEGAA